MSSNSQTSISIPKMYLVLSFDYGGESNVNIDAITTNLEQAKIKYEKIVSEYTDYNVKAKEQGCMFIVNLIEITKEFTDKSIPLFFNELFHEDGYRLLKTNNN